MSKKNEGLVEITIDGQNYSGEWIVDGDMITVRYAMEKETTQLGNGPWPPIDLAKTMLGELVMKYEGRSNRGKG